MEDLRCIVVSVRTDRELLVIEDERGLVAVVEIAKTGARRCKLKVRACPRHKVYRRRQAQEGAAE